MQGACGGREGSQRSPLYPGPQQPRCPGYTVRFISLLDLDRVLIHLQEKFQCDVLYRYERSVAQMQQKEMNTSIKRASALTMYIVYCCESEDFQTLNSIRSCSHSTKHERTIRMSHLTHPASTHALHELCSVLVQLTCTAYQCAQRRAN